MHLCAVTGEFEHLLVADFGELAGPGGHARVCGVDAVDVGVDLAAHGAEGCGEGDGGGVGASASERGDVHLAGDALEAGDDDDASGVEFGADAVGVESDDGGAAMRGVRADRRPGRRSC